MEVRPEVGTVVVAAVAVVDTAVEATEPLLQAVEDKSLSITFVHPSTFNSFHRIVFDTDCTGLAPVHCWLAGYEGPVSSSWYVTSFNDALASCLRF